MAEGDLRENFRRHEISAQEAGDGVAVVFCDGREEAERAWAGRVPLPAEGNDGVAVAQQPRVAGVVGKVPVAAVDERDHAPAAAIGHFKNHGAVAFVCVFWAHGDEFRGELDFAVFEVDGVGQIDDLLVVGIGDWERKIDTASDALVGSGVGEGLAVEDVGARGDLNAEDSRVEGKNGEQQGKERQKGSESRAHGRKDSTACGQRRCPAPAVRQDARGRLALAYCFPPQRRENQEECARMGHGAAVTMGRINWGGIGRALSASIPLGDFSKWKLLPTRALALAAMKTSHSICLSL